MIRHRGLALGHLHLLGRVDNASLDPVRGCKSNRVLIHLGGGDVFGRGRVPRVRLGALYCRVEASIEVLDCVLRAAIGDPLDAPTNRSVIVSPPELDVFRLRVLEVGRAFTITCADSFAILVAPHEPLHSLTVEGDRPLSRANGRVLETGSCPPGAGHVRLVGVSCGDLGHLAGQRRLIGGALTDNRAVIERERERCSPLERRTTLRRHGRDRELLTNSQSLDRPGACNVDLRRGLTRRGRGLRDLSLNLRCVVGAVCGAVGQRHGCYGDGGSCGPNLVFHRSFSLLVLVDSKYVIPRAARC